MTGGENNIICGQMVIMHDPLDPVTTGIYDTFFIVPMGSNRFLGTPTT